MENNLIEPIKRNGKKGFTLVEMIVIIALISILVIVGALSVKKIIENRALKDAKWKMSETIRLYADKSYNDGLDYEITFDFSSNEIIVKDSNGEIDDELKISENLKYYINVNFDGDLDKESFVTNANGGIERLTGQPISFSIYIFDLNEEASYRIAIDGINTSGLLHMSMYKNDSSTATYSNIATYSFVASDWEKEEI